MPGYTSQPDLILGRDWDCIPGSGRCVRGRYLHVEDKLGTLEATKLADVVAVEGNPLEDLSAMRQVVFVMKEGEVFKQP